MSVWKPIYEWRWRTFRTRSASKAAMLKRAAARYGEEVERAQVGLRLKTATARKLNDIISVMRDEGGKP